MELNDSLKKILVNEIPVPVKSLDIADTASFKNMIISYEKKSGATVETGNKMDLSSLKGATGYAIIDFTLNENFEEIPIIKHYLHEKYSSVASYIKVSSVRAKMIFEDLDKKEILAREFSLKKGKNNYPICELNNISKDISSIDIKVLYFGGEFQVYHSFIH
ncbi:hypothetical protein [Pleurocapsa sp. FMAR1]|uniref:hypothetical protein n=1 Tax=Pleurocapsa sp. FMAR1 TaxID=3040204 RepID=UPI0029C85E43|nr:hypothetical protein [Pleurocapsa sp. FMAR1]